MLEPTPEPTPITDPWTINQWIHRGVCADELTHPCQSETPGPHGPHHPACPRAALHRFLGSIRETLHESQAIVMQLKELAE
jgi:hypothetical protein